MAIGNVVTDISDGRIGDITFMSASPFEVHHILLKMDETPKHPVSGHLLLPSNTDEILACVVACHGSMGWRDHHLDHINCWLEAGIAVFRLDCFESRNVQSIVTDQMMVTHAMMLSDAFAALDLLKTHPRIDGEKIAVAGWSLGGTVALYSAWLPIVEALSPENNCFAAHLPIYPAAHMRPEVQRWSSAPMLVLHGDSDDYTPLKFVTDLAELTQPHGTKIDVHVYQNAHHSFDSLEPVIWHPEAIRLDHRTVTIDVKGNLWAEAEPGMILPLNEPAERLAAFHYAKNIGAHFGGQSEARTHSLKFGTDFLLKIL